MRTSPHLAYRLLWGGIPTWQWRALSLAVVALLVSLLAACGGGGGPVREAVSPTAPAAVPTVPAQAAPPALPGPGGFKLAKTTPENGPVGTNVSLSAEGLPAGKTADIIWVTVDGSYKTAETKSGLALGVEYDGRSYVERRAALGKATIGGDGRVTANFTVPEDYGEVHDIYLTVDGQDVAKGGFRLMRSFTMTPQQGPVGTMITIKAMGLGSKAFESTAALRYDNKYTGFISATTTRGTAVAQFRAAGPVGKHYISVDPASHAEPFLNIKTGAVSTRHLLPFEAVFDVTSDNGPPPAKVDWPDSTRVAAIGAGSRIPSMGELASTPGVVASVSPTTGPVLSKTTLKVSGLSPGSADIRWVTTRRSDPLAEVRVASEENPKLETVTVGQNGNLEAAVTIPSGVGGWHVMKVLQNDKVAAEVPFYVEQSLVDPGTIRVKTGEKFTIWFKGGGWTELDNGVAVTYDDAYIGYVCGFANDGDTPIELVATGGRGTHLIDIYPYIFGGGHGEWPWQYNLPQLTFAQDHPGLALGYKFPAFRVAIEIVE